jgi:TPR repeat protein
MNQDVSPLVARYLVASGNGDRVAEEQLIQRGLNEGAPWAMAVSAQRNTEVSDGNDIEAVNLVRKAANCVVDGDWFSHLQLFFCFEMGIGCRTLTANLRAAQRHLLRAAKWAPHAEPAMMAGRRFEGGNLVVEPNLTQALRWYQVAAKRGSAEGEADAHRLRVLLGQHERIGSRDQAKSQ